MRRRRLPPYQLVWRIRQHGGRSESLKPRACAACRCWLREPKARV